jgi:hypothetical protein
MLPMAVRHATAAREAGVALPMFLAAGTTPSTWRSR